MKRILVVGGTGTLGTWIVRIARRRDHVVRVLSRKRAPGERRDVEWFRGDLLTGDGVPEAICEVDAIVHAARDDAGDVDVEGTRLLLRLGERARVDHLLLPSVVGIDEIPLRYYRRKLEAERLLRNGPLPWSVLRATQFHVFVDRVLTRAAFLPAVPLLPIPAGFRLQTVAAREVARTVVDHLEAGRTGRLPPVAGPEVQSLEAMARPWLEARGVNRRLLRVPLPGRVARGFRRGKATAPTARRGTETWKSWLGVAGRGDRTTWGG